MAVINLAVGQINITAPYVIFLARKVEDPIPIAAWRPYPSPLPASFNVILPDTGELDPVNYYIDVYESNDGTLASLDLLLAQFVVNAKNNIILSETRFYKVGGGGVNPEPDQAVLEDSYLDGKTIMFVERDGVGRPLVPPPYTFKEYNLHTGGGIELLNGQLFSFGEVVSITISYLGQQQQGTGQGGLYNGIVTISADTTLNATHRNKRIRCAGTGGTVLVITTEDAATVPDGTFFHFTFNDGNQIQTRILVTGGVLLNKSNYTEISISPGEYLRIEKTGTYWEATMPDKGILQVGERLSGTWKDHPNTMPEDGRLLDGDEYPRIWWWISNKLPAALKIITDAVTGPGYVHPADKGGLFVLHSTLKKFRMPNTQNLSERGLKDFDSYGLDDQRLYDYPGGIQNEMVGPHRHALPVNAINDSGTGEIVGGAFFGPDATKETDQNLPGIENRVKNFGVVYLRRI